MSSQSYNYSSTYSSNYSSSTSTNGGRPQAQRYTEHSYSDSNTGTTTTRRFEETGKPPIEETTSIPVGRHVEGTGLGTDRRIEDVSEREQDERDKEYEENVEGEYAKREGGA